MLERKIGSGRVIEHDVFTSVAAGLAIRPADTDPQSRTVLEYLLTLPPGYREDTLGGVLGAPPRAGSEAPVDGCVRIALLFLPCLGP